MKRVRTLLTNQELEIMKIVWKRGRSTVREVYEELLTRRKIAYTTVMTMMGTLEQKNHLKKSEQGRAYVYVPTQPQSSVIRGMVEDFVTRVFNGSARPLLIHLVETMDGDEELEDLRRLLKEKAGTLKEERGNK